MCRYLREKVQFEKRTLRSYWSGIIVHMQDRQEPDCNTDNAPAAAAFLSLFHQQCHPCGFLRNAKPVYPVTGDIKSLLTHVPRRVIQASCNITGKSSIWSFEPHAMNDASTASCAGTTATIFCCLFLVVSSLTCDCLFHIAIPLPNARSLFSTFSACEHVFHILCAWMMVPVKMWEKKSLRILLLVYVIYVQYLFWYLCFAYWTEDWPKAQGDLTPPRRGKTRFNTGLCETS